MTQRLRISGRTRVVGIIGNPVGHSRSPAMHNAAFVALGLNWVYVPFPVRAAEVGAAVMAIRALDLAGVNVTVPHKEAVIAHLDVLTPLARRVGAVNTIVNRRGRLHGDNTDVAGFVGALGRRAARLRGRRVIVVGAGGSARAVLAGLAAVGAGEVILANRTVARARALARRFASTLDISPTALDALTDSGLLRDAALVVNATSLGLGRGAFPPLAYGATARGCLFFDLLYGRTSEFLRRAARAERPVLDGAEMLVQQGARAFTLWTARRPPVAVMRRALNRKS